MSLDPGRRLGPYEILAPLGAGGMGEVYEAKDTRLGRMVAIKVLPAELSDDIVFKARFEQEAKAIARLQHPHICTLHDIGFEGSLSYLVLEYLDGETLAQRLRREALPLAQALRIAIEVGEALDEAHRRGIIHRDLKPGNIMLTRTGSKLLDFGLAMFRPRPIFAEENAPTETLDLVGPVTEEGTLLGTLYYMAPEQLEGREVDERTDVFALGSILYEMLTGERPFRASSRAGLIASIMSEEPAAVRERLPTAPPLLDHLLARCLAKKPKERWRTADDFVGELRWLTRHGRNESRSLEADRLPTPSAGQAHTDCEIEYFVSPDGASVAAARGGRGRPLLVVPLMNGTIENRWSVYAEAFSDREVILYDRRGTGLSERGTTTTEPEPFLQDGQAVVDGLGLQDFDLLGTLLGSVEASWLAAENPGHVGKLVLRSPVIGMADWATIPAVRAALAALEHDWDYFVESFGQLVVGWGNPAGRQVAQRFREATTREELSATLDAFRKLDLTPVFPRIRAASLVEHHPAYFFPDSYSRRIAKLIGQCRMALYSGAGEEFLHDFSRVQTFFRTGR